MPEENLRFILAKPMDVTTYVEHGVADVGIAGKDVMLEEERDVYEVLDLKISKCHLAVAGLPNTDWSGVAPRIATKYPNVASSYFREQGNKSKSLSSTVQSSWPRSSALQTGLWISFPQDRR